METRKVVLSGLLLAIGFMLHQLIPGLIGGMKFDLMLVFIFISFLINPTFKNIMLTAAVGGILSALTTSFPGGQLPNIIDKLITGLSMFIFLKLTYKLKKNAVIVGIMAFIGTMISGGVFLGAAVLITGVTIPVNVLFISVVLPTSAANSVATSFIYELVKRSLKRTSTSINI